MSQKESFSRVFQGSYEADIKNPLVPGHLFLALAEQMKKDNGEVRFMQFTEAINPNSLSDLLFWRFIPEEKYPLKTFLFIIEKTHENNIAVELEGVGYLFARRMCLRVAQNRKEIPVFLLMLEGILNRSFEDSRYIITHDGDFTVFITQSVALYPQVCLIVNGMIRYVLGKFYEDTEILKEMCMVKGDQECRWCIQF